MNELKIVGVSGEDYKRLVALKDEHDPDNLFRLNQNIKPVERG